MNTVSLLSNIKSTNSFLPLFINPCLVKHLGVCKCNILLLLYIILVKYDPPAKVEGGPKYNFEKS